MVEAGGHRLKQNVLRLDITVNHAAPVGVVQRVGDLTDELNGFPVFQPGLHPVQVIAQAAAGNQLHHDIQTGGAEVQHAHDIGVVFQAGSSARLLGKALAELLVPRQMFVHYFHGNGALEF